MNPSTLIQITLLFLCSTETLGCGFDHLRLLLLVSEIVVLEGEDSVLVCNLVRMLPESSF